jgi:hypothetical protein
MDSGIAMNQAPKNREELIEALGRLRVEGAIDVAEEGRLIRHYDELQSSFQLQMAQTETEYRRRVQEDGTPSADKWLSETARELGRHAGEETRRLTDQLRVVTG